MFWCVNYSYVIIISDMFWCVNYSYVIIISCDGQKFDNVKVKHSA
jgi:hypothetical protein